MIDFLWTYLLLPLIHWLIVTLVFMAIDKLIEAKEIVNQSAGAVLQVPTNAKMAEVSLQVTRADGTIEPPQTYRTYRNPLRRWLWAIKTAFTKESESWQQ